LYENKKIFLCLFFVVILISIVYADNFGKTYTYVIVPVTPCEPPSNGVWNITIAQNILCEDKNIILNGSLVINGILSFRNVTLRINNSYDGENNIEVNASGEFYIYDRDYNRSTTYDISNITAYNVSNNFNFILNAGSKFRMYNSFLSYAGWESGNEGFKVFTNNITIINSTLSNNYDGIYLSNSSNNTFTNIIINNSNSSDFYLLNNSINNTALNNSFNKTKVFINDTSNLTVKWYLDVYVNDGTNPLSGATVNITDNKSTLITSENTGTSGNITRQALTEYIANNTTNVYYTPHNITATKSGYYSNSTSINLNESKSVNLTLTSIPAPPVTPPPSGGGGGFFFPICGNKLCEYGENSLNCPKDCPLPEAPIIPVVLDTAVKIEAGSEQVLAGQRVYATITIVKAAGPTGTTNVNLTYWIRDPVGNIIDIKKTTVGIETIRTDIYYLMIPPNSPLGVYTFEALAQYDNATDSSSQTFQVVSKLPSALVDIERIIVPLMYMDDKSTISAILENQAENPLNISVTMFFPEGFEPKNMTETKLIEPMTEELFEFSTTPHIFGNFNGFISIKYDGRGLTRDFVINVYPPFIKYAWVAILILLILIILIAYRKKRKEFYHRIKLSRMRTLVGR